MLRMRSDKQGRVSSQGVTIMWGSISTSHVAERRARYRRLKPRTRPRIAREQVPSWSSQVRVRERDSERWQLIMQLSLQLMAALSPEGKALWSALEEVLHAYWLDVAVDHYNLGYDAGRAQAWLEPALAEGAEPQDKLRALARALAQLAVQLEEPGG